MSTKVVIRIVADIPLSQMIRSARQRPGIFSEKSELVAAEVELDHFAPDLLDTELQPLLARSLTALTEKGCNDPMECKLEVAIQLSSQGDGVRPAMHLSRSVLKQLAAVGASLDFDPYCV